jgi:hypothetical protein
LSSESSQMSHFLIATRGYRFFIYIVSERASGRESERENERERERERESQTVKRERERERERVRANEHRD